MAGKDDLANAVLGGVSDYMNDITDKIIRWYSANDDEKVFYYHAHVVKITYVYFVYFIVPVVM